MGMLTGLGESVADRDGLRKNSQLTRLGNPIARRMCGTVLADEPGMRWQAFAAAGLMLCGIVVPARAQDVGVKAGIVLSNVNIREPLQLPTELQWCCSPWDGARADLTGGIYLTIPLTSDFTGKAELLFTRRGFKVAETATTPGSELRLTYFEIPLLVQVGDHPVYLFSGASIALGVASSATATVNGITRPGSFAREDNVSSFDVGLVMGGGLGRGRYFVEGRYTHGLINVRRESPPGSFVRNKAFLFMAGVRLSRVPPPK